MRQAVQGPARQQSSPSTNAIPEPTLDALAGYEDEARLTYTGGLNETGPEETLAE